MFCIQKYDEKWVKFELNDMIIITAANTATAVEVSCINCPFILGLQSSQTCPCIIWYTGTLVMMKLIIFIKGFNLKDHTEWGGPNMLLMRPAHGLDCPISLSQSRHHICIKCGVSASGGMGLARGMPVHVQFSSGCHIWHMCAMWRHYLRQC